MKIKLFGTRALLEKAKPAQKGVLLIPENKVEIHSLAKVVEVGDGRLPDGKFQLPLVAPGETVFFQTNALLASYCAYEMDGKSYMNLHQDDLIARLPTNEVTVESFEPLGKWCLVKPMMRSGGLIKLPETVNYQEHNDHFYWRFLRAGGLCADLGVKRDDEVLVNTGRANPFQIGEETYCYIEKQFILGMVDNDGPRWVEPVKKVYKSLDHYIDAHQVCPKCGSKKYTQTLMSFKFTPGKPYRDENECRCKCGWVGITDDLVPALG